MFKTVSARAQRARRTFSFFTPPTPISCSVVQRAPGRRALCVAQHGDGLGWRGGVHHGGRPFPVPPRGRLWRARPVPGLARGGLGKGCLDPTVRWIIALGHRPFEDLPTPHMEALAALFLKAGVSMYFCGHGHTYIRYPPAAFGAGAVQVMAAPRAATKHRTRPTS